MTIAFHSDQILVTGTELALFDYAHHNETLPGNASVMVQNQQNPNNKPNASDKFSERFEVIRCEHLEDLDQSPTNGAGPCCSLLASAVGPALEHSKAIANGQWTCLDGLVDVISA